MSAVPTHASWVNTGQGRIFAKRWEPGDGRPGGAEPIVLFHDSLGCVELWREFPQRLALATGRSVIAYDRLGFGKSDPHPGVLDGGFIRQEAGGAFLALRAQLGIEGFIAFGHSVGGGMAVGCAAENPQRCLALVTESAQAFVEDRTVAGILEARREFEQAGRIDRLRKYHGDKAEWILRAWIDTWLAPGFSAWNLDADLRGVRCPVLAIHGDRDEYGSVRHPQRIAAITAPGSTIRILPDCGHVPHREQGDAVTGLVAGWLEAVAGAMPAGREASGA